MDVNKIPAADRFLRMVKERLRFKYADAHAMRIYGVRLRCPNCLRMLTNIRIDGGNMIFASKRTLYQRPHIFVLHKVVVIIRRPRKQ